MPQVVVGAVVNVIYAAAYVAAVYPTLAGIAYTALLSAATSKLFGPKLPGAPNNLAGHQVMVHSGIEYREIGYGQFITSGPVTYNNVSGNTREYLWYQVALMHGEADDLVEVHFDKQIIPKADIAWTAGTGASDGTGTGDVSTAAYIGDNATKAVQLFYYLGDTDQPVCGALNTAFTQIDTNHRLRGVTHLVARLQYDADTEQVWKGGPPNNIAAVLKGRKIYDPRLDTTNGGSGSHRYTDSGTWAWSDNPALCVADYLVNIMGASPSVAIDWPSIASAADDCDELVDVPTAATEKRFTCNGVLSLGATHTDNLDALLSSMDGKLSYTGGVWKVRASMWEASSVSITADDLVGGIQVRGSAPESERFNGVRGVYLDPDQEYQAVEFPHVSSATYLTRDNSKALFYDLELPMTNSDTMAQRLAFRNLEQADNQIVATCNMNLRGMKIAVGDVVDLTIEQYSWSAKTFRCIEWSPNDAGTVAVTLKEDYSLSYDDPIEANYGAGALGVVSVPSDVVPPPSALTATAIAGGIALAWTNPPAAEYDFIDVYESTDNAWSNASRIARIRADTFLAGVDASESRWYWVRAIRLPATESTRFPNSDTSTITATAPAGGGAGADGLNSATVSLFHKNTSDVTPPAAFSGTFTYTFATAALSGGTLNGWSQTAPAIAAGEYLWVRQAAAVANTATDDVPTAEFAGAVVVGVGGSDGDQGIAGLNNAIVFLYHKNTSATVPPTLFSGTFTYTFATGILSGGTLNGWAQSAPDIAQGEYLWLSQATASASDTTDSVPTAEFSTPAVIAIGGEDGATGPGGDPGLPGANTICFFDDADTGLASTSAGKYGFATDTTTGTLTWSSIVGGSILYLVLPNDSTGSTEDYSDFHAQVVAGDVVTWYDADAFPGRWVSWRTTGPGVAITGGYRFPVTLINSFDNGDTDNVPGTGANDVELRWSRAYVEPPAADLIGDIGPLNASALAETGDATASAVIDSDGTYDKIVNGSNTNLGTWLASGASNTDLEIMFTQISGTDVTGASQDVWLVPSTDRTWTLTRLAAAGNGINNANAQIFYRSAVTGAILAVQSVRLICTIE